MRKHYTREQAINKLVKKHFVVFVGGEQERSTDFMGFIHLLYGWSDFPNYTTEEQTSYFDELLWVGIGTIDANIFVKVVA